MELKDELVFKKLKKKNIALIRLKDHIPFRASFYFEKMMIHSVKTLYVLLG